jgi:uncharacterized protein YcfJ
MAKGNKDAQHNPENQDPISHTPGSHPIGVGAGAASAGAAGAAIGGAVGGPIGAVVGAAVGAVAGGLGGKAAAESVNPSIEDAWWRDNYRNRAHAKPDVSYETYRPAYEFGWQARMMHPGSEWVQIEPDLGKSWELDRQGKTKLHWDDAKHAAKDAWDRVGPAIGSTERH